MIWIVGGTSEAGILAEDFNRSGAAYIMTIATEEGKDFFKHCNIKIGRMTKTEMVAFCQAEKISTVADLSHPYALIVSQNAKEAAQELGIKYVKFLRSSVTEYKNMLHFQNIEGVCQFLSTLKSSTVFFTTGSKNISDFEKYRRLNRFVYRVLPTADSIEKCKACGVTTQDIVAIVGPVSQELNVAMFREYNAEYVVLKDSGSSGGVNEKLGACAALKIMPIMIDRQDQDGISSIEKIKEEVLQNEYASH